MKRAATGLDLPTIAESARWGVWAWLAAYHERIEDGNIGNALMYLCMATGSLATLAREGGEL